MDRYPFIRHSGLYVRSGEKHGPRSRVRKECVSFSAHPTIKKLPKSHKFTMGERIETIAEA
jgi:hypothetical protein